MNPIIPPRWMRGCSLTLALLAAWSVQPVLGNETFERLTSAAIPAKHAWAARLDARDALWLAYYDAARVPRLRDPSGSERPLATLGQAQAPAGLAMVPLDSGVGLLWRDKHPVKGLYLARSDRPDEPPLELGAETEPLARFQAFRDGRRLHVLWYGEQPVEGEASPYQVYTRTVDLETGERSPIERLFQGIYPVWAGAPDGRVLAVSWLNAESPHRIVARLRSAGAETFGAPVTIAEVKEISPVFEAFEHGGYWYVFWVEAGDLEGTTYDLQGARSADDGASWARMSFPGLDGFETGSIDLAFDDDGRVMLALSGLDRPEGGHPKSGVRLLRSTDQGATWSNAVNPRPVALSQGFNAANPAVALGPKPGEVLLVWEDWREIRSRLYASLSRDHGETWSHADLPLPHPPGVNLGLAFDRQALFRQGDRFVLIAEQAVDDRLGGIDLVRMDFSLADLESLARTPSATEESAAAGKPGIGTEAELRERIAAFWRALVEGDYTASYDLQDPFFRASVDRETYLRTMGRIKYADPEVLEVRIEGHRAVVRSQVTASVPPFRASTGEMISREAQVVPIDEVWLWVDDAWYREFVSESNDLRFTKY